MEERSNQLTVVVGASSLAEDLRRLLVQRGVAHAGIATHLRGLRKSMVRGESDLVIVCIALDRSTIQRHGRAVRKLLADCHCFPQAVRSIGLLSDMGLTGDAAEMGCDVYAHDSKQAAKAVKLLAQRWKAQRAQVTTASRQAARRDKAEMWVWGSPAVSLELARAAPARGKAVAQRNRKRRHGFE